MSIFTNVIKQCNIVDANFFHSENLFSHSEDVLLVKKAEDDEDGLLFRQHPKSDEINNQNHENKETQILRRNSSNDGEGHLTYQSVLPLVLDIFQPTKNQKNQESPTRDLQTLSFQQLLTQSNQDTDSSLDQVLILKPSSQLPPISDFQVSMKLNDETDNTTSMMEEANQTGNLFSDLFPEPILVEPLNMSELDGSQATWSLENLFNLSLSVPYSTDEIFSLNKNKVFNSTSSHHGVYSDLFQTLVLPSSVGHVASSSEQCSNPSLLSSSSQLFSDPMIHPILDDEKQVNQGDTTTSYATWNQLGIFLDGVQTLTNDDSGWFGSYVTSLECDMEHKKESETFDGNDEWSPSTSAQKCGKGSTLDL